jgi:TolA-binding protein
MYIGECAFDKSKLQKASEAYQMVMNYPESQWFDEALYKYAWTQYRLSNPDKAISSFLALVDLGAKETTGKSLLEKESMDYIAISFSEADTGERGLARAAKFIEKFGDSDKGMQILHRLATVYRDQGRIDMAERTYAALLRMFPTHRKAPIAERELLALRERRDGIARVLPEKQAFFRKYNAAGAWARAQTDTAARALGDSLSEAVFYDAAISQHQTALQGNDTAAYAAAAQIYSQYIRAYPKSPRANECHYNLAEIMFSMGNYYRAAEEYMTVSRRYPDSKYREQAAWNAIVASGELLKQEKGTKR